MLALALAAVLTCPCPPKTHHRVIQPAAVVWGKPKESFWCRNPWVLPVLGIGAGIVIEKQWEDHHRSDGVRLVYLRCR